MSRRSPSGLGRTSRDRRSLRDEGTDASDALCVLEELCRELLRLPEREGRYALSLARTARESLSRALRVGEPGERGR
jgi:hypothetical protein